MCHYFNVSTTGFYDWHGREESHHSQYDNELVSQIKQMHVGHKKNYGAIRVHKYLRSLGFSCSRRRINRLMKTYGVKSIYHAYRQHRVSGSNSLKADNLLSSSPKASQAGEHWAGDMTYLKTDEGPVYMSAVLDLFNRKVIGWSFSKSHDANLVCSALNMSIVTEEAKPGCLFHSDQGSEYCSDIYQTMVARAGMISSMSRAGTPTDNAFVESFFKTLKNELVYHWKFKTMIECVARIVDYVEFYNEDRLHSGLDYMSPNIYQNLNA